MTQKNALKGDILWGFIIILWSVMLAIPVSRETFINLTSAHPYLGGFFKFFILATMGDMLGGRMITGQWKWAQGFVYKAVLWGLLGMAITLVFTVFFSGAGTAQLTGKLPLAGNKIIHAFFASLIMNTSWGPMLYIYHKFGDLFIDSKYEHPKQKTTVTELVGKVDWNGMVSFSWLKTCGFVWIPGHTIAFLLPEEYRVLCSAFLSILLGIIVAFSKKGAIEPAEVDA